MSENYAYLGPVVKALTKERDEAQALVKAMQSQLSRLADACDKDCLPVNVPVDIADLAIAELKRNCELLRLAVSVVDAGRDVRDSTKGAHGLVKAADPRTVAALADALARFDAAVAARWKETT